MKVAYLVNQYPMVSHSFIRREIWALEQLGLAIERVSIRRVPIESLVDPGDQAEHAKTTAILAGVRRLPKALIRCFLAAPLKFLRCTGVALALGTISPRGLMRHAAYFAEACLLRQLLDERCVGHVHAHFGTNSATVAMLCRLLGGPSYSFTVHGPEEFDNSIGLALCEKIQHCRFVVAISNFGRGQLMRWCPQSEWKKIKVVHCAVDGSFLQEQPAAIPDSPRLVCVGRLCAQKGQLILMEALHALHKDGVDFEMVLAGGGEMRETVDQQIKHFGLKNKVHITGWITGDRVKQEILASRAMVLPSFAEGLPVVIMEAFALRRPVISTYVAGIPELVENCKNGWLVPAGSVEELTNALRQVLVASPEQLLRMGNSGAVDVRKRHCATTEAKKLLTYFPTICCH